MSYTDKGKLLLNSVASFPVSKMGIPVIAPWSGDCWGERMKSRAYGSDLDTRHTVAAGYVVALTAVTAAAVMGTFRKDLHSKYLCPADRTISVTTIRLLLWDRSSSRQSVNEWVWLPSSKT